MVSKSKAKTGVKPAKTKLEFAQLLARSYHVVIDKDTINVADLTHAQALVALTRAIDALEIVMDKLDDVNDILKKWTNDDKTS